MAQPERGGSSRLAALLCPAAAGKGHAAVGCEASDATVGIGCAADSAGVSCWLAAALAQPEQQQGGSSRLAALLCPAAAGKGHAAVGCEASDVTVGIGCAADSAGVWCWLAAALAQPEQQQGGSSRLAALVCPAAAGKGHAAVGCEASDATVRIGCAADSAGVWCWLAAALAQPEWGAGRLKPPRFTSPLGCCRCGRQRDAVGHELFEGRIRSDTVSGAVSCVAP